MPTFKFDVALNVYRNVGAHLKIEVGVVRRSRAADNSIRKKRLYSTERRLPKPQKEISTEESHSGPSDPLPDFIIVGTQKGGTTSLYHLLCEHPLVEPATKKEIHYFDRNFRKGEDWYRSHFRPTAIRRERKSITGESTPYYLYHPHAPKRVAQIVPRVKLIALLRNPIDRAYSNYHQEVKRGREHLTFEEAIEAEQNRIKGELEKMLADESYISRKHQLVSYLSRGIYVDQILAWREFFGRDQMLVLKSEDFFGRKREIMESIFDFLELLSWDFQELPSWEFPDKKSRNPGVYAPMYPATRQGLEEFFEPHNQRLYEYLGVDFGW